MVNQSPVETALSRAMIRWSLTKSSPVAETPRSWIFRVEQNGRNLAALKILKPIVAEEEGRGARLLQWYEGLGAATVFDIHGETIFMEWLDGGTLGDAARAGRDDEATIAIVTLVGSLHRPRPDMPEGLQPLRQRFEPLFKTDVRAWPLSKGRRHLVEHGPVVAADFRLAPVEEGHDGSGWPGYLLRSRMCRQAQCDRDR